MLRMSEAERRMSRAWRLGHRTGDWIRMESEVQGAMVGAFQSGRSAFRASAPPMMSDMTPIFERARALSHRTMVESSVRREAIAEGYGFTMLATLFLLFFDEDDEGVFRPLVRGIPSATARKARAGGVSMEMARRAHEIVANDADAKTLVRTIPMRSELVALDEVRRALNLGIADGAVSERVSTGETDHPLWQISEMMDRRTRGNPHGDFPDGGFHWQVNGYINTIDEIVRQGCVPPCGRNCRAVLRPVSWKRAESLGLIGADGLVDRAAVRQWNGDRQGYIDRGLYPDPIFR